MVNNGLKSGCRRALYISEAEKTAVLGVLK